MLAYCPKCGSTEIVNDYFEEEWFYWCGNCGADLTPVAKEAEEDGEEQEYPTHAIPTDEGKPKRS